MPDSDSPWPVHTVNLCYRMIIIKGEVQIVWGGGAEVPGERRPGADLSHNVSGAIKAAGEQSRRGARWGHKNKWSRFRWAWVVCSGAAVGLLQLREAVSLCSRRSDPPRRHEDGISHTDVTPRPMSHNLSVQVSSSGSEGENNINNDHNLAYASCKEIIDPPQIRKLLFCLSSLC